MSASLRSSAEQVSSGSGSNLSLRSRSVGLFIARASACGDQEVLVVDPLLSSGLAVRARLGQRSGHQTCVATSRRATADECISPSPLLCASWAQLCGKRQASLGGCLVAGAQFKARARQTPHPCLPGMERMRTARPSTRRRARAIPKIKAWTPQSPHPRLLVMERMTRRCAMCAVHANADSTATDTDSCTASHPLTHSCSQSSRNRNRARALPKLKSHRRPQLLPQRRVRETHRFQDRC